MTSTRIMVGPEHDITTTPYSDRHARRVELAHPVLMPRDLQAFRHLSYLVREQTPNSSKSSHQPVFSWGLLQHRLLLWYNRSLFSRTMLLTHVGSRVSRAAHPRPADLRICPAGLQDWTTHEIDCTWPAAEGPAGLERALHRLCADADAAIAAGARFTLLTDRAAGAFRHPSLRATEIRF